MRPNFLKYRLIVALCCLVNIAFAGGYQVNLQGVKQTGMGHCGVSLYQGPSAIFFNPSQLGLSTRKTAISFGVNLVDGRIVHYNPATNREYRNQRGLSTPFSVYATRKLGKGFAIGIGAYTPYGSSLSWGDNWAGRFVVTDISLRAIYVQPTISYGNGPWSIGFGVMAGFGSLNYQRDLPVTDADGAYGSVLLSASSRAVGFNIGTTIELSKGFIFGMSYRTKHTFVAENGFADFTVPETASDQLSDQNFSSQISAPSNFMVGLSYQPNDKWVFTGEVNFTGWSVYRKLEIDFENNTDVLNDITERRNWRDSEAFRLGVLRNVGEVLTLRAGFSRDLTPTNKRYYGPETPDSDRSGYHGGFSLKIKKKISFDAAFQWAETDEITAYHEPSGFGGKYKGRAFVYSFGFSYGL